MKPMHFCVAVLLFVFVAASAPPAASHVDNTAGALVIVGGGGTPSSARDRFLKLAGGPDAKLVVFPQASRREEAGSEARKAWIDAGANDVVVADLTKPEELSAHLKEADALWFSGGSQSRLVAQLAEAKLLEIIRRRHGDGVVMGGTSAGAAVMSERMITGNARLDAIVAGATETKPGFALWPVAIVDQHFSKRRRFNRLLSAVIDDPKRFGVGIDERTAVVVHGGKLEVVGESSVVIIDGRNAKVPEQRATTLSSARDVTVHVLPPGDTWSW